MIGRDESMSAEDSDYQRVWFEIDAPGAITVFLQGSFVNWECGLLCMETGDNTGRKGVWVNKIDIL
jgi:hypothetical protein